MSRILFCFVILSFISCSSINWETHTDKDNKFSIQYPNDWEKEIRGNSIIFLSPLEGERDRFKENVNFMLQDLSQQPLTLEQYTDITEESVIANLGKQSIFSLKDVTIQGIAAKEFIYNMNMNGNNLRIKQYWFIKNKTAYLFTYTAKPLRYDDYELIANKIIESFKFL
jgi:serine/threonine-protein kinase